MWIIMLRDARGKWKFDLLGPYLTIQKAKIRVRGIPKEYCPRILSAETIAADLDLEEQL